MQLSSARYDIIVIGGGAAGFFCAVNAARLYPTVKVLLLEKSDKLLSKVKVSGGGRCNVTHDCASVTEMVKNYPRGASFLKKAFYQHFISDTIQWFEERNVSLKIEADGRMFPTTDSSQTVIDCLLSEAQKTGVEVKTKSAVTKLLRTKEGYTVLLNGGLEFTTSKICIAAGGHQTLQKFEWINHTDLTIIDPVPSLFTFNIADRELVKLMGISIPAVHIKIKGTKLENTGPLLITHWGLSGPAVLKLSALGARHLAALHYQYQIHLNWIPKYNENTALQELVNFSKINAAAKVVNKNPFALVSRMWEYFLRLAEVDLEKRYADLPAKQRNKLAKILCTQEFDVKGKTTFKDEFVTAGGICLSEIDHNTMESKKYPGLYFAGEILDVDGVTGGFNFQNAWTTGFVAARAMGS